MANFVKLTNGDIVNIQHIKSINRYEHTSASAYLEARSNGRDGEGGAFRIKKVAAIQLQLGRNPNPILLEYESEQARDTEFERIEAILFPTQKPLFKNLFLNPALIQSMFVEWSGHSDDTLRLRIKAAGTASFVVLVRKSDEDEWDRAQNLLAQLGLSLPRTMREYMEEKRQKGFGTL